MKMVLGRMTFKASVTSLGNRLAHHPLTLVENCTNTVHQECWFCLGLTLTSVRWYWSFPGGSMVKNLPAKQETWVRSLGWKIPWRRKWQPTPVILSGKSHGQRSLVGYSPWGYKRAGHNLTTKTTAAKKNYTEVSKQVPTFFRLSFFIYNPISQSCHEERKEKC